MDENESMCEISNRLRSIADHYCFRADGELCRDLADRIDAEMIKLQASQAEVDALKSDNADLQARLDASIQLPVDADGVPCRIGDLLETEEHIPRKAVGYYLADESTPCVTLDFVSPSIEASLLHHVATEQPDSQERIDADARLCPGDYTKKFNIGIFGTPSNFSNDVRFAMVEDLLRRQRELYARKADGTVDDD